MFLKLKAAVSVHEKLKVANFVYLKLKVANFVYLKLKVALLYLELQLQGNMVWSLKGKRALTAHTSPECGSIQMTMARHRHILF